MTTTNEQSSREQDALKRIVALDPEGVRGDDLGLAVRIAREALSSPIAITAEEAGREGEAKDASLANNCGDFAKLTEEVARDAMRYRCIRNVKGPFEVSMHGAMFWNEGLDAVADAAMLPPAPAQSGGQG